MLPNYVISVFKRARTRGEAHHEMWLLLPPSPHLSLSALRGRLMRTIKPHSVFPPCLGWPNQFTAGVKCGRRKKTWTNWEAVKITREGEKVTSSVAKHTKKGTVHIDLNCVVFNCKQIQVHNHRWLALSEYIINPLPHNAFPSPPVRWLFPIKVDATQIRTVAESNAKVRVRSQTVHINSDFFLRWHF